MRNEFQKHKKRDGIKWVFVLLAVLMLGVAVTAAITSGFKNWNPYGWLDKPQQETPTANGNGAFDENGNSMESGKVYPLSSRMLFSAPSALSETASNGVTLSATITPADATYKAVDWAVVWVNASSAWANGKTVTDYMTITPTEDGALTATVNCLQAFGEQIKITVTSRENASAKAECVVDYAKKVTRTNVTWKCPSPAKTWQFDGEHEIAFADFNLNSDNPGPPYYNNSNGGSLTYEVSEGTVEDTYSTTITISPSQYFIDSAKEQGITVSKVSVDMGNTVSPGRVMYNKMIVGGFTASDPAILSLFRPVFTDCYNSRRGFDVRVRTVGTYTDITTVYTLVINPDSLFVRVSNVTLNNNDLIF